MAAVSAAASNDANPVAKMAAQKLGTAELLFRGAQRIGLQPTWVTPGGLFAVATSSGEKYVNAARSPLNSHASISLVKDKYLTRLILERHALPNIPFTSPKTLKQAAAFLSTHHKIIVKPRCGLGAQDVHIIEGLSQLADMDIPNYIFEKYIAGREMRYLVLNEAVIAVHRSEYGTSVEATRPLQRISYTPADWDATLTALSVRVAGILGMRFAAIDYMIDTEGTAFILEVNSNPGLKWFHAPTSGPVVDVAQLFLEAMVADTERPAVVEKPVPIRNILPTGVYLKSKQG